MLGRTVFSQNQVFPTRVSADGSPSYKAGGVTIDWSNVAALGADTTFPDGSFVKAGQKVLRYGQVLCKETANGTQHTLTGTATGGTFTYTVVRNDNGQTVTTPALAFKRDGRTGARGAADGNDARTGGQHFRWSARHSRCRGHVRDEHRVGQRQCLSAHRRDRHGFPHRSAGDRRLLRPV